MLRHGRPLGGRCLRLLVALLATAACGGPAHAADEIHWTLTGPTSVTFDWRGPEVMLHYGPTAGNLLQTAVGVSASPIPISSFTP